jgi:hypothetical protein
MQTWGWIVIAAATVLLVVLVVAFVQIRRRRSHLKERFGSEYYRTVSTEGTASGEKHLSDVEHEHEKLTIRPLPSAARDRYRDEWRNAEARFVSDPREAARAAERIVERALDERGYPRADDTQAENGRAAVVAVDHGDVVDRYRHGHAMLDKIDGNEGTENLRKAMLDFRAVLDELLDTSSTKVTA